MEKVDQNPANVIAPLIKVLRGGLLTLPAATRRKLGLRDGDYLQAVETEEGVLLKPVTVVDRKEAWGRVMAMVRRDKWKGPGPRPTPEEEEQWIFDVLVEEETTTAMPKAVFDSSVLISAFITPRGTSAQLLEAAYEGRCMLYLSLEIVAETTDKLLHKKKLTERYNYTEAEIEAYLTDLLTAAELVSDLPDLSGIVPDDPKDDMLIATAVAAKAEYLITGDRKHLLERGEIAGVRIETPRAFLEQLNGLEL